MKKGINKSILFIKRKNNLNWVRDGAIISAEKFMS